MTFNLWTFVLQMINFLALAYILRRLLYRPLHEAIDRRREAVRQAQADADKARAEADEIKRQLEEKLSQLDRQRQDVLSQAYEQAQVERKKILDEAQMTAQRRQEEVRRLLEREREEMLRKLSGEASGHALSLAGRLLQQSADSTLNAQLAKRLIETLDNLPEDQREQLRYDLRIEDQAWLETATPQDDETLKRLTEAVAAIAGKELALRAQTNPALIGGVRLRIGGHLWDASIAGQLEEAPSTPRELSSHV
jgi:F-type H+-transporting ATPase subunit b